VTPEQPLLCSPGTALYVAKLLTFQHLFSFYTKASQGPLKEYIIFADISVPEGEALLWLHVSHLWLCQKIVHSLFSQAKLFPCSKVPRKQTEVAAGERRPGITAHNLTFYYLSTFTEHSLALIHQCKKPANTPTRLERLSCILWGSIAANVRAQQNKQALGTDSCSLGSLSLMSRPAHI